MGHCDPALLRIYTKVSSTQRVLQMTYRNVRALAAKVTVCLCWLPAPEQRSLSTCAGTGTLAHTTHLPSRQKGARGSVTRYPGALDTSQLHLFQPSSKYVPSVPAGGAQGSHVCKEVQDLTAKPSLALRGRRERHGLWHPLFNSHCITCLE